MINEMKKNILLISAIVLLNSCQNFGQLTLVADLPKSLNEVSGVETFKNSKHIWIINDGGNKAKLYRVSNKGKIKKGLNIETKNRDWEDLTFDEKGNLYIGDFGNNENKRKNLRILKIKKKYLKRKTSKVEKIEFKFENQKKFPPKDKEKYFDCEAFFYFKEHLYLFTKSRVHKNYGKTSLYKIPAKEGKYKAKLIGDFENCTDMQCWITSADISEDGKKVALLSQKNILIFSDFKGDNFLSGNVKTINLEHQTQKEGICFKDNNTLLITDEKARGEGGNLYELLID
jgi:hypothetical protein